MCERVTVVTLSLCVSLFDFGEGSIFSVETYQHNLGDNLIILNVAFFRKLKLFWRKSE